MNLRTLYYKFWLYSFLHQDKGGIAQSDKKCVFVFLAADYGNLGDVAITYAQERLLQERFPDYEIVDVPINNMLSKLRPIKKIIKSDDIITITGGGNMGEMYGNIELRRLLTIRMFPKNKVVVFPQTTDYEGKKTYLFNLARSIYSKHQDLTLLAREDVSYAKMKDLFPSVKSHLVPDIVMTLDLWQRNERNGILFCLRNDMEKSDMSKKALDLEQEAIQLGLLVNKCDTHIGKNYLSLPEREEELESIWHRFSSSQIVVTDRLHGMIFAYITGTPAIVFPNSNFKVEKCYEWIKNCGYIFFCKDKMIDLRTALQTEPKRDIFEKNRTKFIELIKDSL